MFEPPVAFSPFLFHLWDPERVPIVLPLRGCSQIIRWQPELQFVLSPSRAANHCPSAATSPPSCTATGLCQITATPSLSPPG